MGQEVPGGPRRYCTIATTTAATTSTTITLTTTHATTLTIITTTTTTSTATTTTTTTTTTTIRLRLRLLLLLLPVPVPVLHTTSTFFLGRQIVLGSKKTARSMAEGVAKAGQERANTPERANAPARANTPARANAPERANTPERAKTPPPDHIGSCRGQGRKCRNWHRAMLVQGRVVFGSCPCCVRPPSCPRCLLGIEARARESQERRISG